MSPMKLDRRSFLRGMLGGAAVTVGLPAFEIFLNTHGTAYASGEGFPKRFGLFFWGNGILPAQWNPTGSGTDWVLSEQLAGLAPVKNLVTVVTGMSVKIPNVEPHTAGAAGILSGAPLLLEGEHRTFTAPTIDQVIAQEIGTQTRFRSIEFGAKPRGGLSYNGPDNINPAEESPIALFDRIFGGGFTLGGDDGEPDPRLRLRRSILDAVMTDASSLHKRLGTKDKERLDQHLSGIRDLEKRVSFLIENPPNLDACSIPTAPTSDLPDIDGRPQLSARNRIMTDIIAMAMACDQTRVWSNFFTFPVNNLLFPDSNSGHHQLTHDEPGDQPEVSKIVKQIVVEYAYVVEKLQSIPEGSGTMLDNCVVFGTSDTSFGRTHSMDDFPILLAGSAGGKLRQGIHYNSPSGENASKALLSLVRAMDINAGSFGAAEGESTSGLGAIEV